MIGRIRRLAACVSAWLDAGWDDYDKPTYVDDSPCSCPSGSISTGSYKDVCPRCGGRVRYMNDHPTDEAARERGRHRRPR